MEHDTQVRIIELMAEKIAQLEREVDIQLHRVEHWQFMYDALKKAVLSDSKKKRGRPPKKRGPGRPKGSKNKVRK